MPFSDCSSRAPKRRGLAGAVAVPGVAVVVFGGLIAAACAQQQTSSAGAARASAPVASGSAAAAPALLTGQAALGDWTTDAPGVRRLITTRDLPRPYATPSANNGPRVVARPEGAWPKAPEGFTVEQFATGLENPRVIVTAPNGDLFVAESGPARVKILRDADGDGKPETVQVFASGLRQPFGIAFYPLGPNPRWVYVANTDSVIRFPYQNGDLAARGPSEVVVDTLSAGGRLRGGGHWTRDIDFSRNGKTLFVSIGSLTNVNTENNPEDERRARIFAFTPEGKNERVYAWGIRNPVGLAVHPQTGQLWTSVNERDGLGDYLPPEYITRVQENGFYGWPWYYIGSNWDPRHRGKRPDLFGRVTVPDVLLQSHSASLDMAFYTGRRFPREYHNDAFAAEHGSWNRARRTGYKVIRVPLKNGKPTTGEYQDFLTGFVTDEGNVWGRPVGVTTARDGSLMVTDDGGNCVWRIVYAANDKMPAKAAKRYSSPRSY